MSTTTLTADRSHDLTIHEVIHYGGVYFFSTIRPENRKPRTCFGRCGKAATTVIRTLNNTTGGNVIYTSVCDTCREKGNFKVYSLDDARWIADQFQRVNGTGKYTNNG